MEQKPKELKRIVYKAPGHAPKVMHIDAKYKCHLKNMVANADIVKTSHGGSTYYAKIEWDDGSFWVTNHDIQMPSYISEVSKTYLEVIGNIHDNPELLEVTE